MLLILYKIKQKRIIIQLWKCKYQQFKKKSVFWPKKDLCKDKTQENRKCHKNYIASAIKSFAAAVFHTKYRLWISCILALSLPFQIVLSIIALLKGIHKNDKS